MEPSKQKRLKISNDLLDNFLAGVKTQDDLWGKDGIITQLNKAILERILNAEVDFHLHDTDAGRTSGNTRNGHSKKKVSGTFGKIELETPRDRQSTFEPQIVPKLSTKLGMIGDCTMNCVKRKVQEVSTMKEDRQDKLKISNDLLDAMLVGVKNQDDLWGKEGIITQLNKALLERILNAEMDFHLDNTHEGRAAGNSRNGYGKKTLETDTALSNRRLYQSVPLKPPSLKRLSFPCTLKA